MKLIKFPEKSTQLEPDESALRMAEDLLEWCKSGAVRHVAVVGIMSDGTCIDGYSGGVFRPYVMLGALEKLKLEYAAREIQSRD